MEDIEILNLYFQRDQQAVVETDRKYGPYCFTLANSILHNDQDAEEAVSDTYWKAWTSIPPKKPVVLKMFLAKITRNLSFTRWRSYNAQKRGGGELELALEELEGCIASPNRVEDDLNAKELAKAIRAFLNTLPVREQDIFLRRYFFLDDPKSIARRYTMNPATVHRTLSRTREKLKTYLTQEGYAV